jgi:hypothetical protein
MTTNLVSISEAGRLIPYHIAQLYFLIKEGSISTVEISGRKYLTLDEVERLKQRRAKRYQKKQELVGV